MSKLPLKIRQDIRDKWDSPDSEIKKAIASLSTTLGTSVLVQAEWQSLWSELEPQYADKATFVPGIAAIVGRWCDYLDRRLDDANDTEWAEQAIDRISDANGLKLRVDTCRGTQSETSWDPKTLSFVLRLPKAGSLSLGTVLTPLNNDLVQTFQQCGQSGPGDGEWTDIVPERSGHGTTETRPAAQPMPSLTMLSRPDILFPSMTPYLLTVTNTGSSIAIRGSHQPSLELLCGYLQKWSRQLPHDISKLPILQCELKESNFGFGAFFDSIIITTNSRHYTWGEANPILIRTFIEGVLEYKLEHSTGNSWAYRRDTKFQ